MVNRVYTNQIPVTVTLNRPKALNALSSPLFKEINDALTQYDEDKDIGAIIITGSEKAFAGNAPLSLGRLTQTNTDSNHARSLQPAPTSKKWPP